MKKTLILLLMLCYRGALGQDNGLNLPSDLEKPYFDSVIVQENGSKIIHYNKVARELSRQMIFDTTGYFFDAFRNNVSRLIFNNGIDSFNVPTVPLTKLIYIHDKKLILGLSKIVVSPDHILLYTTQGKLISKRTLSAFELSVPKNKFKKFLNKYPFVKDCITQGTIITKTDSCYYIEASSCIVNGFGRGKLRKSKFLKLNHLAPNMLSSGPGYTGFYYAKYEPSFLDSNPVDSLIMEGEIPQAVILNFEKGRKVELPLKSNCDINKEIR